MIRRWLPKGTSFEDVTDEQVQQIENWMNKYPRGILGFASAEAAYQEQMAALFGAH
jgi:IS30 family transposase